MSSGPLDLLRRNIGVRLGLWYAIIFMLSTAALFALAYYLLAAAVGAKDQEVLEGQLKEAASVYQNGGANALRSWVRDLPVQVQNTMLVRLVNGFTHVALVVNAPPDWVAYRDVPGFEGFFKVRFIRIPLNAEKDFIRTQVEFGDGSILQIGRTTNSREAVLNPIRRSFFISGSATLLFSFVAGAFFAHRAMQPV